MRGLRFLVEAAGFTVLLGAARITPRRVLRWAGSQLGILGYLLDRRHRAIALDNLRGAFGSKLSPAEARSTVRACWRHFGSITLETLAFPRLVGTDVGRIVSYEGLEYLRAALEVGKGVLVFSGHFGHWELAAVMQGRIGPPMAMVARPLDNWRLEGMLKRLRGCSGNRVIHKRNAVREIMRALRAGSPVAIVIDQDARKNGVFVPFFGRLASTTPTLATLAMRTGATVLPIFCVPERKGRYRITFEPPVRITRSGDHEADVVRITAECTAIIERWVRRYPKLWLWMHRRWKTRPPEESMNSNDASRGTP